MSIRIHARKARQPAPPVPMPDQTPILITDLLAEAIVTLKTLHDAQWARAVTTEIHAFVAACAEAGITEVPDPRLSAVALPFVDRATTRSVVPSDSSKSMRRAAVRALLRVAVKRGVLVPDPYATNYDRVVAGQDFPVAMRVKTYIPKGLPPEAWDRVRPTFEDWVPRAIAADAGLPYNGLTTHLSRHLIWCDECGIPRDVRRALDSHTIDRSLRTRKDMAEGARSAARSILGRVGQALGPQSHPLPIARSKGLAPYSQAEEKAIIRWILAIPEGKATAGLWPVVVFGLGAGFDVPAFRWLRGTHVSRQGRFVVVHDSTERDYPVAFLPKWEKEALRLAEAAGEGFIIHPSINDRAVKGLVSSLITLLGPPPPGTPGLDTRRLRATWIVHQMRRGIDPTVLLGASGVGTWGTFDRYREFVPAWPDTDEEAFAVLRGDD